MRSKSLRYKLQMELESNQLGQGYWAKRAQEGKTPAEREQAKAKVAFLEEVIVAEIAVLDALEKLEIVQHGSLEQFKN